MGKDRLGRHSEREGTPLDRAACSNLLNGDVAAAETEPSEGLAAALNELGLWCKQAGRYTEALEHYRHARGLLDGEGRLHREDLATIDHNLAGVHHASGRYAEGEVLSRRGLAIRLAGPRPDTEFVARDLVALAGLVLGQGRWSEPEALYAEGIALLESHPGDQRLELAVAFNGLGVLHGEQGDYLEAANWLEDSATLKRQVLGPSHPDLALTLRNLAVVRDRRGSPGPPGGRATTVRQGSPEEQHSRPHPEAKCPSPRFASP